MLNKANDDWQGRIVLPTYEYCCDNEDCKHRFEIMHGMKDDALTDCPECKKDTLRRLIGRGSAVIFKGSGFYVTDYPKMRAPPDGL